MSGRITSSVRTALVPAFAAVVLLATAVSAAPGDLDPSFSGDGSRTVGFGESDAYGLTGLIQADGRIVVGGHSSGGGSPDFTLVRLRSGGSLDTSFGGDGIQTLDFRGVGGTDVVQAVAQQSNGRLVAVGNADDAEASSVSMAVARFLPNGDLDTSFSGDGMRLIAFPGFQYSMGEAVAVQADGRILVGGTVTGPGSGSAFAVARLKPNGQLDPTYGGGDGLVTTPFAGIDDGIRELAVQPNGRLVAGGWSQEAGSGQYRSAFVRYTAGGVRDGSFSGDGKLVVDLNPAGDDDVEGLAVRPDGKIVAAARVVPPVPPAIGLVRLTAGGALDPTFSGDGMLLSTPTPDGVYVRDLDLGTGNRLLVTGDGVGFFLGRYDPNGALDTTFGGGDGFTVVTFPGSADAAPFWAAIQTDGRIVLGGSSTQTWSEFAVARYLP